MGIENEKGRTLSNTDDYGTNLFILFWTALPYIKNYHWAEELDAKFSLKFSNFKCVFFILLLFSLKLSTENS